MEKLVKKCESLDGLSAKCRICGKSTKINIPAEAIKYYICDECAKKLKKLLADSVV